jgi:phosphoribosylamine--glycine ligase
LNILVIGGGGREHALGWKIAQSPLCKKVLFAPGNPGTATVGENLPIAVDNVAGLVEAAKTHAIDLVVVGPELPLTLGLADALRAEGIAVFGPNQDGALVEGSKAYAKQLMQNAGVPTADYAYCTHQIEAVNALSRFKPPFVVKEDGLAAGKGVTIARTRPEAEKAIDRAFARNMPVVLESFLEGEELSILAICDGKRAIPCVGAQDFKRVGDGNTGPNTGGMGAYAPVPFVDNALLKQVQTQVLNPMMRAFQAEGIDYRGVLYAGLMIAPDGRINVVEFNARFGDPETQVVLPLMKTDLLPVLKAAAEGDLSAYAESGLAFDGAAVTVVVASNGYPNEFEKGVPLQVPATVPADSAVVFHAGTALNAGGQLVSAGGRVLTVTAWGDTVEQARERAYALVGQVQFEAAYYRTDIAKVAVPL